VQHRELLIVLISTTFNFKSVLCPGKFPRESLKTTPNGGTMKNTILGLILTMSSFAQANTVVGTLTGLCQVGAPENEFHFNVPADDKAVLGLYGVDGSLYRVTVTNNSGAAEKIELGGYAAGIGLRRDDPYFRNPPTLCPVGQPDCNQNTNTHIPAATDAFHSIENDGYVDAEYIPFRAVAVREKDLQYGSTIILDKMIGGVEVHCEANFNK
jgi:hypothetical protein